MHPFADLAAVDTLRAHLPSFEGPFRSLLDDYGEDLTPQVVFQELAELVTAALLAGDGDAFAEDAFSALEHVAALGPPEGVEAVGFCFLGELPDEVLALADAYVGPRVEAMLAALVDGSLVLEG